MLVGRAEELSFGQQALGFFGEKTPGSPPLPAELVPGSSRVPQLRSPPTAAGTLSGAAGYYDLLPFAGLVGSGGAVGLLSIGGKYRILSETDGAPVGHAVHAHFGIPIHKSIDFLLTHPVGTADLQFGFDGIVSKRLGGIVELYWNVGYRHINQACACQRIPVGAGAALGLRIHNPPRCSASTRGGVDRRSVGRQPYAQHDVRSGGSSGCDIGISGPICPLFHFRCRVSQAIESIWR